MHSIKAGIFGVGVFLWGLTAYADTDSALCAACQMIFANPVSPVYPRAAQKCAKHVEKERTWCIAANIATFYLRRAQVTEFAILYDNILNRCPSPQAREYFKARLYYLATQLDPEDIPSSFKSFDFGSIQISDLGQVAHGGTDDMAVVYKQAVAKHRAPQLPYLIRILDGCNVQHSAPTDR